MRIGGFQKQSLIDYPGKISSVIFTSGCNLRCPFCHNPDLVLPERISQKEEISKESVIKYLAKNKKLIDGVVISGGEPTLHSDLPEFIEEIKKLGFLVKLDTNGTNPEMLKELLDRKLLDYVSMDIKAPFVFEKHNEVVGNVLSEEIFKKIIDSKNLLLNSKIEYEFRTTVANSYIKENLLEIAKDIKGAKRFCIQKFNPDNILDAKATGLRSFSRKEIESLSKISRLVKEVECRD